MFIAVTRHSTSWIKPVQQLNSDIDFCDGFHLVQLNVKKTFLACLKRVYINLQYLSKRFGEDFATGV
jgi:hypothetical protein